MTTQPLVQGESIPTLSQIQTRFGSSLFLTGIQRKRARRILASAGDQ